jgi:hypothetical protein
MAKKTRSSSKGAPKFQFKKNGGVTPPRPHVYRPENANALREKVMQGARHRAARMGGLRKIDYSVLPLEGRSAIMRIIVPINFLAPHYERMVAEYEGLSNVDKGMAADVKTAERNAKKYASNIYTKINDINAILRVHNLPEVKTLGEVKELGTAVKALQKKPVDEKKPDTNTLRVEERKKIVTGSHREQYLRRDFYHALMKNQEDLVNARVAWSRSTRKGKKSFTYRLEGLVQERNRLLKGYNKLLQNAGEKEMTSLQLRENYRIKLVREKEAAEAKAAAEKAAGKKK